MAAEDKRGMLITDPAVAERMGTQAVLPETVWLLNRQAIAREWGCTPPEIEGWPAYEREVALLMLNLQAEADKRRPKKRKT